MQFNCRSGQMAQSNEDIELGKITSHELNRKRWKYIAYRGFCEFVASDNDFFILRRFSQLTAQVLLALQGELSELEAQLCILETYLSSKSGPDVHSGSFREETQETRLELVREIDTKLRSYSQDRPLLLRSLMNADR